MFSQARKDYSPPQKNKVALKRKPSRNFPIDFECILKADSSVGNPEGKNNAESERNEERKEEQEEMRVDRFTDEEARKSYH